MPAAIDGYVLSAHTICVIELGTGNSVSSAIPAAFFARWIDHATWSAWNPDTEWVELDGPVALGTHGILKPVGGQKARFVISTLDRLVAIVENEEIENGRPGEDNIGAQR